MNDNSMAAILRSAAPLAATEAGTARARRIDMYSRWLKHDADGLAYNLRLPRIVDCTADILTKARSQLVTALELIDNAIAVDREAKETESTS